MGKGPAGKGGQRGGAATAAKAGPKPPPPKPPPSKREAPAAKPEPEVKAMPHVLASRMAEAVEPPPPDAVLESPSTAASQPAMEAVVRDNEPEVKAAEEGLGFKIAYCGSYWYYIEAFRDSRPWTLQPNLRTLLAQR